MPTLDSIMAFCLFCMKQLSKLMLGYCWLDTLGNKFHGNLNQDIMSHLQNGSHFLLTHWGRDRKETISQKIFSNAFSWMKMLQLRLKFHWSLFPRDQLTIFQHWFRSWLGAVQSTSHYLNQWWSVYWCIYASLGLNELINYLQVILSCGADHENDNQISHNQIQTMKELIDGIEVFMLL